MKYNKLIKTEVHVRYRSYRTKKSDSGKSMTYIFYISAKELAKLKADWMFDRFTSRGVTIKAWVHPFGGNKNDYVILKKTYLDWSGNLQAMSMKLVERNKSC